MRFRAGPLALCLLAGCSAGAKTLLPSATSVIAPVRWLEPSGVLAPTPRDWWSQFGSANLTTIVQTALDNNTDLAMAAARVAEARADEHIARSALRPTVDLAGEAFRDRDVSPFGEAERQTAAEPEAVIAYDADLFGRLRSTDAAAKASLLSTKDAQASLRLAVAATAATSFITLLALDERLEVAKVTLADREAALHLAKRRAEVGYTSQLELKQAEAEYRATLALVPQAALAVTRQENALNLLMGRSPGPIPRGPQLVALTTPPIPSDIPAAVLRQRPDIAAAEQQVVAADHRLDAARAAFLPDVRLTATGGDVLSTLIANPIAVWSVGGSILAPLFEGGRLTAEKNVAKARRTEAAFNYRKTALTSFREVEDGLAATRRTQEQLDALASQRDALAQALRLARNRYAAGYSPYLDQLDAQRGLLNAELGVVQARSDRLSSAVQLFQATGGGWRS